MREAFPGYLAPAFLSRARGQDRCGNTKDEAVMWGRTPSKAPPESSQFNPYPGMACFDFVCTGAKMVLIVLQLSSVWFKAQPDLALLTDLPSCLPLCKLQVLNQPFLPTSGLCTCCSPLPAPLPGKFLLILQLFRYYLILL